MRAGAAVVVQVASGWEDRVRIGWGNAATPVTSVQVDACPATSTSAEWSVFTGGTWVASPECAPLMNWAEGRQVEVRLAVGAGCDEGSFRSEG